MVDANDIVARLAKKWPHPAYVCLREVRNGTGVSHKAVRYADVVFVSTWPSRGLYAIGVEVKCTLADFRREAHDPEKAEAIGKYCRHWYIAAPKGVVPHDEIPSQWGLIECTEKTAKTVVAAPEREAKQPDWPFFASLCRSIVNGYVTRSYHSQQIAKTRQLSENDFSKLVQYESLKAKAESLQSIVDRFEEHSGVRLNGWNANSVGNVVRAIELCGVGGIARICDNIHQQAKRLQQQCERLAETAERLQSDENPH